MVFFMYLTGSSKRRELVRYSSELGIREMDMKICWDQVRRLWIGLQIPVFIPVLFPERTLLILVHLRNSIYEDCYWS